MTAIVTVDQWPRPIAVYFGARDERDLYLINHFGALTRLHGNLTFTPVLSEPARPTPIASAMLERSRRPISAISMA